MTRPDETDRVEQFSCFRAACSKAKDMSDKHCGSAVVIALDDVPDGDKGKTSTGHIEFNFGVVGEKVGSLEKVDVPKEISERK